MLRNLPKWLADPLGPLSIPPAYLPKLLPWLIRFWRAGAAATTRRSRRRASRPDEARRSGMDGADAALRHARHAARGRLAGTLRERGRVPRLAARLGARDRFGIGYRHVAASELAATCSRACRSSSCSGTFVPGWKTVERPEGARQGDLALCRGEGRPLRQRAMSGLRCRSKDRDQSMQLQARAARIIGAGRLRRSPPAPGRTCWRGSSATAIPLETERGYNTTLPKSAFDVKRQLIFSGHGFVITPLETGVRVGGAVELGGLAAAAQFRALEGDAGKGAAIPAGARRRRRARMDGLSPVAAGFAAGDRPREGRAECLLCLRPRPSRPDPGRCDGALDPRSRAGAESGDRSFAFRPRNDVLPKAE